MDIKPFSVALNASAAELRKSRVANFVQNAKSDAELILKDKERSIRDMEDKLARLLDLGEDQTISIASKIKDIDTKEMMKEVYQLGVDIELERQDLKIMQDLFNSLFPA